MKIEYIKTKGFRKFKNTFKTNLYNVTEITGKNRSGKSNILYAIVNCFLGTNLSGDEKASLINKNSNYSYLELHFVDNEEKKHVLIRRKHKFDNAQNYLSLDGKIITQTELVNFFKDKKLFLSIFYPQYFLTKKGTEQKEMIDKYLSNIEPIYVFKNQDEKEQENLLNRYYKEKVPFNELSEEDKKKFVNLNMINIFMDIAYDKLENTEQKALEGIPKDIPTYISEVNYDIKSKEKDITALNGKIEYANNIICEKLESKKTFEKEIELNLARQELSFLTTNQELVDKEKQKNLLASLENDILNYETEIAELDKKMSEGKKKYLNIKKESNSICPTCGQKIADASKLQTISSMKESLTSDFERKNLLLSKKKDKEIILAKEKCKYYSMDGETTIEKEKRIETVKDSISLLEKEEKEIQKFNSEIDIKEKNISKAKEDISVFKEKISSLKNVIDSIENAKKVAQKLYIFYIEEKMKYAKKYLKDVDIRFYSVLKSTGEIKEDFIITYKGNKLQDLSKSETVATALEFANMFNKLSNTNLPIFIDDAESSADYDFVREYGKGTQLFISKVKKGQNLKISDVENADNFTVIKPTIAGYKTMKLYKNHTNAMPKAA